MKHWFCLIEVGAIITPITDKWTPFRLWEPSSSSAMTWCMLVCLILQMYRTETTLHILEWSKATQQVLLLMETMHVTHSWEIIGKVIETHLFGSDSCPFGLIFKMAGSIGFPVTFSSNKFCNLCFWYMYR